MTHPYTQTHTHRHIDTRTHRYSDTDTQTQLAAKAKETRREEAPRPSCRWHPRQGMRLANSVAGPGCNVIVSPCRTEPQCCGPVGGRLVSIQAMSGRAKTGTRQTRQGNASPRSVLGRKTWHTMDACHSGIYSWHAYIANHTMQYS